MLQPGHPAALSIQQSKRMMNQLAAQVRASFTLVERT